MPAPLYKTNAELSSKIDDYFAHCKSTGERLSVFGLCVYLDINYDNLSEWSNLRDTDTHIERSECIKKAKTRICATLDRNDDGRKESMAIFALKNIAGWTDRQQQDSGPQAINITIGGLDKPGKRGK